MASVKQLLYTGLVSKMRSSASIAPLCVQEARVSATTKQECLSLGRSLGKSSAVTRSLSPYEAADLPQVHLLLSTQRLDMLWY